MAKQNKQQRYLNVQQVFGDEETVERVFSLTESSYLAVKQFAEVNQFKASIIVDAAIREGLQLGERYYNKRKFEPTRNKLALKERWDNEVKKIGTYTITTYADDTLDKCAYKMGEYRSELLECVIRSGALQKGLKLLKKLV